MDKKYNVAVLTYPLLDPAISTHRVDTKMELHCHCKDKWKVPVYIHVPFCSRICNFCVYTRDLLKKESEITEIYTNALVKEIEMYGNMPYIDDLTIGAIFLGGGTPTSLTSNQLCRIIKSCKSHLPVQSNLEITVECNVLNADEEKIHKLYEHGVTRISSGIQTFNSIQRKYMGLTYPLDLVYQWIEMVKKYSFNTVSIDLLYGLPSQSINEWVEDLNTGINLNIDHLSIYELYIMSGSVLYNDIYCGKIPSCPKSEERYGMFQIADSILKNSGFEHHIIPEYNKKGKKSEFWELTYDGYGDNLSFGVSSFGFINGISYQNHVNVDKYLSNIEKKEFPIEKISQKATHQQMMERTMALAIRRKYVEKKIFEQQYGKDIKEVFDTTIESLVTDEKLVENDQNFSLTTKGEYMQNDISVEFMKSTFNHISSLRKQLAIGKHIVPTAI